MKGLEYHRQLFFSCSKNGTLRTLSESVDDGQPRNGDHHVWLTFIEVSLRQNFPSKCTRQCFAEKNCELMELFDFLRRLDGQHCFNVFVFEAGKETIELFHLEREIETQDVLAYEKAVVDVSACMSQFHSQLIK